MIFEFHVILRNYKMIIYAYCSSSSRQMKWWQCSLGSRMSMLQCLRSQQNRYSQNNFQQVYRQFQILSLYPVARWVFSSYVGYIKLFAIIFVAFLSLFFFSINLCFTLVVVEDFVVSKGIFPMLSEKNKLFFKLNAFEECLWKKYNHSVPTIFAILNY